MAESFLEPVDSTFFCYVRGLVRKTAFIFVVFLLSGLASYKVVFVRVKGFYKVIKFALYKYKNRDGLLDSYFICYYFNL